MAENYGSTRMTENCDKGLDNLRELYHSKKFTDLEAMIRKTNSYLRAMEEYLDIHYEEPTIPVSGMYVRNSPSSRLGSNR